MAVRGSFKIWQGIGQSLVDCSEQILVICNPPVHLIGPGKGELKAYVT